MLYYIHVAWTINDYGVSLCKSEGVVADNKINNKSVIEGSLKNNTFDILSLKFIN